MLDFFSSFATRPRRPRRVARASQSAEVPSRASEARVTRSRRRDETSHGGMTKKTHVKKFLRRQRRVAENARVAGDRNFARLAQIALAPGQDAGDRAICARAAASRLAKLCAAPELVASKRVRETSLEEGDGRGALLGARGDREACTRTTISARCRCTRASVPSQQRLVHALALPRRRDLDVIRASRAVIARAKRRRRVAAVGRRRARHRRRARRRRRRARPSASFRVTGPCCVVSYP